MEKPEFKNLPEFVAHLRANIGNLSPVEVLDSLQTMVGPNVSVKYEMIPGECKQAPEDYPTSKFAGARGQKLSRVILSTNKRHGDMNSTFLRQLNGVVFQYPGWKVLCVPAPMLNTTFDRTEIASNISEYNIFSVIDGTIVNAYWYEPENSWRLSSTNGYDVTTNKWLTGKTYLAAITELAADFPDFSFDKLDKNFCYTIGFRHHDFQPLLMDPQRLWFIQACNTSLMNNLSTVRANMASLMTQPGQLAKAMKESIPVLSIVQVGIGLPVQTPMEFAAGLSNDAIVNNLIARNKNAVEEFTKQGDVKPPPHYGYVLRPKHASSGVCDILLESTLLQMIKRTLYNFPKKRNATETMLTSDNRLEYAKLRAYLGIRIKYPFITLYPQFAADYTRFDAIFNKVATMIVALAKKNPIQSDGTVNGAVAEIIASKFSDHIKKKGINVTGIDGVAMAMDIIVDIKYLEMYFTLLSA